MWVIEVVGCVSEGVDFEFSEEILGQFLQEPVDYHATFDTALTVENENYFRYFGFVESFFDGFVAVADVVGGVIEVSLD